MVHRGDLAIGWHWAVLLGPESVSASVNVNLWIYLLNMLCEPCSRIVVLVRAS